MKNNKGYTLVELLVSVAIFSIVMIGIVSIMSSTSVMYRNGHQEVKLQEEAQIALNQLEEILVDADNTISTLGTGYYSVNNTTQCYGFKQDGDKLFYKKVAAADAGSLGDAAGWVPMSDYVKSFEIRGIQMSANRDTGDNRVEVVMEMENADYSYVATKDVYFRNAIENQTPFLLPSISGTPAPAPPVTDYVLKLRRFEVVNLKETFGLASVTGKTDDGITTFTTMFTLTENDGSCIALKDVYNNNFGTGLEVTDNYTITGPNLDGTIITIAIEVEPVVFNKGEGIIFLNNTATSNNGGFIWLETKGLDMREAITGIPNLRYDMILYRDKNFSSSYDGGDEVYKNLTNITFSPANLHSVDSSAKQLYDAPMIFSGLAICPSSGNLIITQANPAVNNAAFFEDTGNGRVRIQFKIYLGGIRTETVDYLMLTNQNSVAGVN